MHRADVETAPCSRACSISAELPAWPAVRGCLPAGIERGLDDLLALLARHAPTRVRLLGLAADESADLIESVTGAPPDPAVVESLALTH